MTVKATGKAFHGPEFRPKSEAIHRVRTHIRRQSHDDKDANSKAFNETYQRAWPLLS